MKFSLVFLILILIVNLDCLSQIGTRSKRDKDTYTALKVGDSVPNYLLTNLINFPSKSVSFSELKGKLVILDFWDTGCASCIASWPHLLEIQKEFNEQIQIILVNPYQKEDVVRNTFERRKKIANINMTLPSVCYDTTILKLFPVSGVPHVIWIDKKGILKSVTYSASINSKNISRILMNKEVMMPQKIDNKDLIPAVFEEPLFVKENGGNAEKIYSYSIFAKGDERLFPTYGIKSNAKTNEYFVIATNQPPLNLYRLAYSNRMTRLGIEMVTLNRVRLQVKDSSWVSGYMDGEIQRNNLYVYQLILPFASMNELQSRMRSDLQYNIGLEVEWIKKRVQCLVFTADDTTRMSYKDGPNQVLITEAQIKLNNVTVKDLINRLESYTDYYWSPYPFIDETGFRGKLGSIDIETDILNHSRLDKALKKYGMRLQLAEREIALLLITDGNYKQRMD